MTSRNSDRIVEAYDKAVNELLWIQSQVEAALTKARNTLIEARKEALKEARTDRS